MKRCHFSHLPLIPRAVSPLTVVAQTEVCPRDEMAHPAVMKMFPVERHERLGDFVDFRIMCGVQSSQLGFDLNGAFECGPLQGQGPGGTLCFWSALF